MAAIWKTHINERVALAKFSLATENFTTFHVLSGQYYSNTDNTADLDPVVDAHIKKINTGTVDGGQDDYKTFSDKVESLKNQSPDPDAWKKTIADAAAAAKAKSAQIIDDAAASATAYIDKLPPAQRNPAANLFTKGLNAVMAFFENIYSGIKAVAAAVIDFLKGIWNKIKETWNTVVGAAKAAWNLITGGGLRSVFPSGSIVLPESASAFDLHSEVNYYLGKISANDDPTSRLSTLR